MKLDTDQRDKLWNMRAERLSKLLKLNAPRTIIEAECFLLLRTYGIWRLLWSRFVQDVRLEIWYWVKLRFWYRLVCRKTMQEIDDIIINE